ncbi:hypothetical protein N2152v2_008635 [Parachlorella kessleri]
MARAWVACLLAALAMVASTHGAYTEDGYEFGKASTLDAVAMLTGDTYTSMVAQIESEDGAAPYMASAVLTGTAELPAPIETNTTAYFHIAIGKNSSVWALLVDGIANFTMSHLHYGNSTTSGPVAVPLGPSASSGSGTPMYNPPFTGSFVLMGPLSTSSITFPASTGIKNATFSDLQAAIDAGMIYANLHNTEYPAGVVRATLEKSMM